MASRSGWLGGLLAVGLMLLVIASAAFVAAQRNVVDHRASRRLGDVGGSLTSVAGRSVRLELSNSARAVFEPADDIDQRSWTMDVAVDPASKYLSFSMGIRDAAPADGTRVRFTVSALQGKVFVPFFDEAVPADEGRWHDRVVPVPLLETGMPVLQLAVASLPGDPSSEAVPFGAWGSVRTVTEKRGIAALRERWLLRQRRELPNVVLVSLDTLGASHLGSFGGRPNLSPNIDAALRRGASFRRAYSHYPNTLVSHASLFTGLYPKNHRVYDEDPFVHDATLAEALSDAGYVTLAVTEDGYIAAGFGFDRGFDRYDNGPAPQVDQFVGDAGQTFDEAIAALRVVPEEVPVFLFVHTYEVHTPYVIRDDSSRAIVDAITPAYDGPYRDRFDDPLLIFSVNDGTKQMPPSDLARLEALYEGEINYLDRRFGEFLERLERLRPAQRTLLVVTADHGEEFMEHRRLGHGETLHTQALHVPLSFAWQDRIAARQIDDPIGLVDVFPTVADLVGLPSPDGVDGRSQVASVQTGRPVDADRPVFSELRSVWGSCRELSLTPPCRTDAVSVRTNRFAFIASKTPSQELLFDTVSDPKEATDVSLQHPEESNRFRDLVRGYRVEDPSESSAPEDIDDEVRARLRALGYTR
jgi:arylsulfatase A-like enzyme